MRNASFYTITLHKYYKLFNLISQRVKIDYRLYTNFGAIYRNHSAKLSLYNCSKLYVVCIAGNIVLHIFSHSAREHYDLETLWTVGSQYDDKTNAFEEPSIMDQYNAFLADLQPADDAR